MGTRVRETTFPASLFGLFLQLAEHFRVLVASRRAAVADFADAAGHRFHGLEALLTGAGKVVLIVLSAESVHLLASGGLTNYVDKSLLLPVVVLALDAASGGVLTLV